MQAPAAKPPKQNLSKEERSAIQDLRRDQAIHILQADKGNATIIMDQDVYDDKIEEILQDKDTYSKLNRDPTQTNERKNNQQLLTLHRSDALPKALYFQIRSSTAKSTILFGQPKIHKLNTPLRPIISIRASPCYDTARHLANILQSLVGQTQHHVTNSKHFIDVISKTKIRPSDALVSFGVVSLFTSVPVDQACDIIKQRLITDSDLASRTNLTPDQIHDLLLTCLNSNSFKWRNNYYKQLQGAAMGSPLSRIIANIFIEHFEHHTLKITMETQRDNSIPFLDVLITKTPSGFPSHQVYRKPTHTDRYLNFRSHHHPSIHQSVADTHQTSPPTQRQGTWAHLQQELKHVANALATTNHYPRRRINTQPSSHQPSTNSTENPSETKPITTIVIPYIGKTSHRLQRILHSANMIVRHKSSRKLHSILHSHNHLGDRLRSWVHDTSLQPTRRVRRPTRTGRHH
ncbi:uncharacterized protein LOC121416867 [Lytechinus variegatus]|uniref:uncharacterized protein LOC121416867 n=1 Tax=Lytechinus variegatus TaxID=7654 RepID=UPI001BB29DE6|nr:uncharacterized protein LOC121416867 [Lytechinus variegatus]